MRLLIAILGSVATALFASHRSSLSVAVVAMAKYNNSATQSNSDRIPIGDCSVHSGADEVVDISTGMLNTSASAITNTIRGDFDWDERFQGIILGASYYSYLITPTISGRITEQFGSKWVTLASITVPTILLAVMPVTVHYSVNLFIVLLFIKGLFHGCIFTSLFSLFAHWFTTAELPIAVAALAAAFNFGNVLAFLLTGYLCDNEWTGGWPSVFYVLSAAHIPWIVLWFIYVEDTPLISNTKGLIKCTEMELKYIMTNKKSSAMPISSSAPWRHIFTSRPLWAAINAKVCAVWGYYLFLCKIPAYLDKVFGMSLMQNGMYNAMISLATGITMALGGPLSALIIKRYKNRISKTNVRKLFESVALVGPAICLLAITQIGCHSQSVIALLIIALFLYGLFTGGEFVIYGEMAPDYSATLFGIAATLGVVPGFAAPYIVGVVLEDYPGDLYRWNLVFYITIGLYMLGAIGFLLFASAEPQHWGVISVTKTDQLSDNFEEMIDLKTNDDTINYTNK
ncbi:uncharacterized transporter slc-17.2-like [Oppia nitens]|uniref:uncharacterized transporter slc-17.2-like n=1 Tax=Oppia nitens TaxID=1686743 RepID=UPI0023DC6FCA|nr:uncharacterized transporter slc-17.2-like [Oppia nitens]